MANTENPINPLSAIAPGIFRKIFEFDGSGPPVKRKAEDSN